MAINNMKGRVFGESRKIETKGEIKDMRQRHMKQKSHEKSWCRRESETRNILIFKWYIYIHLLNNSLRTQWLMPRELGAWMGLSTP